MTSLVSREREIEAYLKRKVGEARGLCVKIIPDYARGFPDRLVLLPSGVTVWIETKRPRGGRLSVVQRVVHTELRALGQRVEVVWTKAGVDELLRELTGR